MVQRKEYLNQLIKWKDDNIIKVITGIRRCGKSTLLKQFQAKLLENGISEEQIVFVNFEDLEFEKLQDYGELYRYVSDRLQPGKMTYVFLDEIQNVDNYEKVVNSLQLKENVDIYITGSNAYLLSSELSTKLSGRYIEIKMLPLSFAEYCELKSLENKDELFAEYMRNGGFPYAVTMEDSEEKINMYLEGIYNTIVIKDIEERQKRKEKDPNKRKITDIALLNNIAKFLAGSIGNPVSVKSIADYITSSGRKISQNTVDDYISALIEPYIFYPVERYDVQGKQLLKSNRKMYIADTGLRRHILSRSSYDLGFTLENIVYLELFRRGYKTNVGKLGNLEVDFVAEKNGQKQYFQVTASMMEQTTFEREMKPLQNISDNYPKTVITLDRFTLGDYDGIKVVNAVDWLLDK
ncbi:MAG: ATP-binding protein [Clostridiales bacterium]|nr:ATP-binding protein [Clostridiales bacterium]